MKVTLAVELPDAAVEAVAARAAQLVLAQLPPNDATRYLTVQEAAERLRAARNASTTC